MPDQTMTFSGCGPRFLALLALLSFATAPAFATELAWEESDWSQGAYDSTNGIDPEIAPGRLVLAAQLDDFRYLASPTGFQGIYCMAVYHDTLWLACSDYPFVYDGADVLSYDYPTQAFDLAYQPYESGLNVIKIFGDTLYIPGPDSMDPWGTPGSIYTYDGHSWLEKATIDSAVHVCDIEIIDDIMVVTTGQRDHSGGVWTSFDSGDTFTQVLSIEPTAEQTTRRFFGAGQHQGHFFVQPDGFAPEGRVLYSSANGLDWTEVPLDGMPTDKQATFFAWNADTLLAAISNKLFLYDGQTWDWEYLPFSGWRWCRGFCVRDGELLRVYVSTSRPDPGPPARLYVSACASEGRLVSKIHDFATPVGNGELSWEAHLPAASSAVRFQIRSAASLLDLAERPFVGPDGSPATHYTESGAILPAEHDEDRFFQYAVELLCPDGESMPVLERVTLRVDSLGAQSLPESDHAVTAGEPAGPALRLRVPAAASLAAAGDVRLQLHAADYAPGQAIRVRILDPTGRTLRRTELTLDERGSAIWRWDLRDQRGRRVASGHYVAVAAPVGAPRQRSAACGFVLVH